MEQIKELTKRLIANSFKELMLQTSFDKITIKMITDHASVIRPTFYNHFHDKYELMEWILRDEVLNDVSEQMNEGNSQQAIDFLFSRFYEDREYYRKAFEIEGQNGFAETLLMLLSEVFNQASDGKKLMAYEHEMPHRVVSQYYASGLISMLKLEIEESDELSSEQLKDTYSYLTSHTLYEIIK